MRTLKPAGLIAAAACLAAVATTAALVWGLPFVWGSASRQEVVDPWPVATSERCVTEPQATTARITIVAVGDLMCHTPQRNAARTSSGYDFTPCFTPVASRITSADLAIGNLETPLAGADAGYSGYPAFNNPDAYAEAAVAAGFDVLTTANNHALDRGMSGLKRTRQVLEKLGVGTTGTARTAQEAGTLVLRDVEGIKVAVLAYTYGMNGLTPPSGSGWAVNVIDRSAMKADIARARAAGADIVLVSIHNGVEYQREPSGSQAALERAMVEAGADAVLGSHPHVVQPMEVVTITRADGTTREAFIAHSLGNFVSGQRQRYRDTGIMVRLSFSKDLKTGVTSLVGVDYVPTWVDTADQNGAVYRILPIGEVLADDDYPGVSTADRLRMRQAYADTTKHLGSSEATSADAAGVAFWGKPEDAR